jgi:hypothetical protein
VAVQPDPSTRGGGGSNAAGRQNAGASATGRNDNRGSWQDDQHSGDDRHDNGGRHDNGSRHDGDRPVAAYSGRGGIVIEPIVIREVYVGSVRLSPATTIGQRVVIGGGATPGSVAVGPGRGYVSAPVMAWSEETIYLDDGRQEQRLVASDEPVSDPAELPHTPPDAAQTRAMLPSLAALGPAYTFRPWYAVSEFIMAGYPSPYPEALAVTYDKRALAANADLAPAAADALQAGRPLVPYEPGTFGGLVFQIGPSDAAIYVDDVYVGLVEDFTPGVAPLPLPVGPHRLELRARGYRVEAFEVIVTVGQVTPLSGLMAVAN